LRLSSFGGYGLALAALALVVFGAYDSYLSWKESKRKSIPFNWVLKLYLHSSIYCSEKNTSAIKKKRLRKTFLFTLQIKPN